MGCTDSKRGKTVIDYNTSPVLVRIFDRFDQRSRRVYYTAKHEDGEILEYNASLLSLLRENRGHELKRQLLQHLNINPELSVKEVIATIMMLETDDR